MTLWARRRFLELAGLSAAHVWLAPSLLSGCGGEDGVEAPPPEEPGPQLHLGGLLTGLLEEHDYAATVEGTIPPALRGALYRNGPGLFERDGVRKSCLIDGDGAIHGYWFTDEGVRFRNRFVRTAKFVEEEAAGKYLYDGWTTKLTNEPGVPNIGNQAGVSVRKWRGALYAFDEGAFPYTLDPDTLETVGEDGLGFAPGEAVFAAHNKKLVETGEWAHMGVDFASAKLHLMVFGADGARVEHLEYQMAPLHYVHDFFATRRWLVVHLHPAILDLPALLGGLSVRDALNWKPEEGSKWLVFARGSNDPPLVLEGAAAWMWHVANAHEQGGELLLDWVGYDNADHVLGPAAELCTIMSGEVEPAVDKVAVRRTVIDPQAGTLREEALTSAGSYEFPIINPRRVGLSNRYTYLAYNAEEASVLLNAVQRVDVQTGKTSTYDFGPGVFVGEPVFAPDPDHDGDGGADERGWILTEITEVEKSRGSLVVLDAANLEAGPVAMVRLKHHLPIKFHGEWTAHGEDGSG